jgi:hypothetical protein
VLFRLEGVRGSEPPSCCPAAFSFWLDVLSFDPCKTDNPSTHCFLSKAGPEGLLSKRIYQHWFLCVLDFDASL